MLFLARELAGKGVSKKHLQVILGYRDEAFLSDEFKKLATVHITGAEKEQDACVGTLLSE